MALKVELRYASLPSLLRFVAVHYWFVVYDQTGCHRWEVWQTKNVKMMEKASNDYAQSINSLLEVLWRSKQSAANCSR
jgi:predicted negative regulator of RcsB-dependent stress response